MGPTTHCDIDDVCLRLNSKHTAATASECRRISLLQWAAASSRFTARFKTHIRFTSLLSFRTFPQRSRCNSLWPLTLTCLYLYFYFHGFGFLPSFSAQLNVAGWFSLWSRKAPQDTSRWDFRWLTRRLSCWDFAHLW